MKKKRICSRADMTDQQARDQVNLSEYAADIIKQTETDYGKKLSTAGWGKIMDYLEDMIYDTKKSLSDSERKNKIEDYIYQIYESDTGIKDVYTSSRVTCSVDLSAQNYASTVMKDPVKVSIGGNDDEIVSAIMEMNKDDLEKLYNSVIRKYFKMTQESSYQAGRKSRLWEKSTPHMSERDLIDSIVYFVQEGAIVPTKKASNIKGGTYIMRKKRFNVRASMSAKRRNTVSASRMRSVRCARTSGEVDNVAVRELVLYITNDAKLYPNVLSIIENMKRKVKRGQYNDDLAIKAWQYLADDGVRKYDKEFGSNNGSVSMLNPATRKEIAKQLRDYYKDQVFEDVEASKSVRCARTTRKRPVKASTKRRFAVKASVGDSVDVDEIKQILRDAGVNVWSVKKTRTHEGDLFEIVFDNSRDYSKASIALEDAGFDVKFDSSNGDNVLYFKINDNREAEAYLYRVVFEYNNEVVPMDDETSDYQSVLDACIDNMESEGKTGYLYTYDEAYDYAKDLADDEADVERIMEEEFVEGGNHGLYLLTAGNFNIIPIGFGKASEYVGSSVKCAKSIRGRKRISASKRMRKPVKASFDPSSQYYKTLRVLRDNINMEFNDTIIGNAKIEVDDIKSGTSDACSFTIWIFDENGDYDKDTTIKIVSTEEAFANDTFLILVGMYKHGRNEYMEISRFGAKKIVADKINEIAESMSDGVTASTSIKCSDPIDSKFMVDLYYSPNHRGHVGDRYFYDWSEVEEYAHEALMNGLYVSIWNKDNGDTLDISPDEYNDAWENGAADFDINEDIVNFKRRIVESAKSIKCDDEIEDEITEDDSDLTIDISQLELSEPYYETREDDPENPDKWVLVIGKNPERHMNYKLWYYVDSTDADLTGLDLSSPDHIDIDEESTFEDYDDIQLSSDVSCCGDERYSAGLVTM